MKPIFYDFSLFMRMYLFPNNQWRNPNIFWDIWPLHITVIGAFAPKVINAYLCSNCEVLCVCAFFKLLVFAEWLYVREEVHNLIQVNNNGE